MCTYLQYLISSFNLAFLRHGISYLVMFSVLPMFKHALMHAYMYKW